MKYKEKLHIRHKKMNLRELCHYVKFKSGFGWIKIILVYLKGEYYECYCNTRYK